MKKIGLLFVTVIMLMLFAVSASAGYVTGEGDYTYAIINNDEAEIRSVSKLISGDVTIPSTLRGRRVTSIGDYAFTHRESITSITIPDSVTSIGVGAFSSCESLTSVAIPDSVTFIGDGAFNGCTSLTSVTIPDSVISIGDMPFDYCTSLASIIVDENNKNYSNDSSGVLFDKNKNKLIQYPAGNKRSSYIIPDSVISIENRAFAFCYSLESISVPYGVISIGGGAFWCCWNLTSITIPDSVTSIGGYAFHGCRNLTSLTIPISVTTICKSAFGSDILDIYYGGNAEHWNEITIDDEENGITKARIHFSASQFNHPYLPTDIIPPTCKNYGYTVYSCECGYSYEGDKKYSSVHNYNANKVCLNCGYVNCYCDCHKDGILGFFWKIANFFNKLFKIKSKQMCACGIAHY